MDRLGELAGIVNRSIEGVRYAAALVPEAFAREVQRDLGDFDVYSLNDLEDEQLIVAEDGGAVGGFIHVATKLDKEKQARSGVVRYLAYEPDRRATGQALIDAAEDYLREKGVGDIICFPKGFYYHFIDADGGISERFGHIPSLLARNGYEVHHRTFTMALWPIDVAEPDPPTGDMEIEVEGLSVRMYASRRSRDAEPRGMCLTYRFDFLQPVERARQQAFVQWLVVDEALRGDGWGRYLLQRSLWEAQERGFKECVLCTSEGNYTARLLYASLGFTAVESLVKMRKAISH
jgi:GNAT superfamily N-acetyltransferase